jgi:hypothetical protein
LPSRRSYGSPYPMFGCSHVSEWHPIVITTILSDLANMCPAYGWTLPGKESGRESSQSEAGTESRVLASFLLHGI